MYSVWIICLILCFVVQHIDLTERSGKLILTPYIKRNKTEFARLASVVDPALFLGVQSHSGFLTVDERYNSNLFFWYFPVARKPVNETPWIIWLQGGPGGTSLVGLFSEIGPFQFDNELKLREWSWGKEYSLLFIDNPVGSGFSFTDDNRGYASSMAMYGGQLRMAVEQLLQIFPELQTAPLYLAGESYAGRYVPALGDQLTKHTVQNSSINFKGLILGNPVFEREDVVDLSSMFYHFGLIDGQGLSGARPLQEAYAAAVRSGDYNKAIQTHEALLDFLEKLSSVPQLYNILKDKLQYRQFLDFLTAPVQKAIHVSDGNRTEHIPISNFVVHDALRPDFLSHPKKMIESLLGKYKILIYCGQLDLILPCTISASGRRKTWKWEKRSEFMKAPRIPIEQNETITGYVKSGGGLTEVLVRGAGHMAPSDKPAAVFAIIEMFINDTFYSTPPTPADDISSDYAEYIIAGADADEGSQTSAVIKYALGLSVVFNVVLIAGIVARVVYRRSRRRLIEDTWLYSEIDPDMQRDVMIDLN